MTHEAASRPVFRLWLFAFAGIVAALSPALPARAGELALEQVLPEARFADKTKTDERRPIAAFSTENGVYELDEKTKSVRIWPKAPRRYGELVECRFDGLDSAGAGTQFSTPVSFCKKPGEKVIAVVDACPSLPYMEEAPKPRVAFYSFTETVSGGVLSSVSFTFQGEISNPDLSNASGVAFFPAENKVAVSLSGFSSGPSAGDTGIVHFYEVPSSAGTPVEEPFNVFRCVRAKNVYEGSATDVGAEPFDVPISSVSVDPDGKRIWAGSESLNAVVRYDPVAGDEYEEEITVRTWESPMDANPRWVTNTFEAATADFVQGARGAEDLGTAGSTNNLLSAPASIQMWASPNGDLLVVADTDNDRVVAFDSAGNARFTFNPGDRHASAFSRPRGAWVSDDGSELVVADTGNGRVEVFALTDADSALDETISLASETPFFLESDAEAITNWIVATTASPEDRVYTITIDSDPAGGAVAEPSSVTLPAGALRVPFAIRPLDGAADGTVCTLSISGWETNAVFVVSNVPPSVRTGAPTATGGVDNGSYMYIEEGAVMDVSDIRLEPAEATGGSIHFHAKAFDVVADDLTYEWLVLGVADTIFRTVPYYYYEYEEGVPPVAKTKEFTPEEVAEFPEDGSGNKLYIEVRQSQQVPDEILYVTNVLSYAERTVLLDQLEWASFLFDDEQGAEFVLSSTTLNGPDAEFTGAEEGVLYFAILTVTDKDGGVWRSISSPDGSYFCFMAGGEEPPPVENARYAAVFTDVSGTNVAFRIWLVSGVPQNTDQAELRYAASLTADEDGWKPLYSFFPGRLMLTPTTVTGKATTLKTGEKGSQTVVSSSDGIEMDIVYENEPNDDTRFYRIYQTRP